MHLEEQPLHSVVGTSAETESEASEAGEASSASQSSQPSPNSSADLLVACYSIIESAVAYMAAGRFDPILDERQRGQVENAKKDPIIPTTNLDIFVLVPTSCGQP